MKKQLTIAAVLAVLVLALTTVSADAQGRRAMKIDIPFDFIIGGDSFEAGEYTVGRLSPQKPSILILKSRTGESRKIFLTQPLHSEIAVKKPRVIFSKYEGTYFLAEVWAAGVKNGAELRKSKSEQSLMVEIAKARREKIVLTASLL